MRALPNINNVHICAQQRGFTLIELVVVILVIGVLAVSAASRFDSTSYAEYSYQSRLLSALRAMQQRAMQDTRNNYCFQINFNTVSPAFGPPTLSYRNDTQAEHTETCAAAINYSTPEFLRTSSGEIAADGISMMTLDTGNGVFNYMRFDSFGRPITSAGNCQATCRITFQGSQSPAICVESEGYIHECS